jgi:hypothetical protein
MKVQMSSGVTDRQRCSHSESERPLPASISSSIEIAPPVPSMRITCSSFGTRSRIASILASCSSSSTITAFASEFSSTYWHSSGEFVW